MTYRNIDTSIWKDDWFLDLDPNEKLLFIYLFSNENTTLTGLYKINLKVIEFETNLSREFITATLDKFSAAGKVYIENSIVWVVNLRKYNQSRSPKVDARIAWELRQIPDCKLKATYLQTYSMVSIEYQYSTDSMMTLTNQSNTNQSKPTQSIPAADGFVGEIYRKFENNIGIITGVLSEKIDDWLNDYPHDWILDAITEAATHGGKSFAYVDAILKSWQSKGKSNGKKPYIPEDHATEVYS